MKTLNTTVAPEVVSNADLLETAHKIGPTLGQFLDEEESNRRPSRPVLKALRDAGFSRLFMPESLGGIEADPLTTAKVVEEIARHNTTAAWAMMVANTSTWWCSRLSDKGIDEIYKHGTDTFIAGAFHPPMQATPVENGYLINGRSPLASNVHEAQWIFVTAFVIEQGKMKMNNGIPEVIGVFMHAENCQIIDTWYAFGMRATDSNDVVAHEVFVPDHLSYALDPVLQPNRHYRGRLYRFPAFGASIASLIVPIALSIARNAISELKMLANKKIPFGSAVSIRERATVQRKLGMAEAFVQSSHAI